MRTFLAIMLVVMTLQPIQAQGCDDHSEMPSNSQAGMHHDAHEMSEMMMMKAHHRAPAGHAMMTQDTSGQPMSAMDCCADGAAGPHRCEGPQQCGFGGSTFAVLATASQAEILASSATYQSKAMCPFRLRTNTPLFRPPIL